MATLWGLTEIQFLLLYAGLILIAAVVRVVVTDGVLGVQRFDGPDAFFSVLVAVGVVRSVAEYICCERGVMPFLGLMLIGVTWFFCRARGPVLVRRPLFWVMWGVSVVLMVAAGTVQLTADSSSGEVQAAGVTAPFFTVVFMMIGTAPHRGGGGAGCGGGCGGG